MRKIIFFVLMLLSVSFPENLLDIIRNVQFKRENELNYNGMMEYKRKFVNILNDSINNGYFYRKASFDSISTKTNCLIYGHKYTMDELVAIALNHLYLDDSDKWTFRYGEAAEKEFDYIKEFSNYFYYPDSTKNALEAVDFSAKYVIRYIENSNSMLEAQRIALEREHQRNLERYRREDNYYANQVINQRFGELNNAIGNLFGNSHTNSGKSYSAYSTYPVTNYRDYSKPGAVIESNNNKAVIYKTIPFTDYPDYTKPGMVVEESR